MGTERKAVWFNKEDLQLFAELEKKVGISQNFREFAKRAFHDKVYTMLNSSLQDNTP